MHAVIGKCKSHVVPLYICMDCSLRLTDISYLGSDLKHLSPSFVRGISNCCMDSFDGPEFVMTDGSCVKTKTIDVAPSTDITPYLSRIREDSCRNGKQAVVFELYWDAEFLDDKAKWRLSSVKFSTKSLCLMLRLPSPFQENLKVLCRFFASKSVTFVGLQIEEDLALLKEAHGIVIRKAVDLGKLAARARRTPGLEFFSSIDLARRFVSLVSLGRCRFYAFLSKWELTDPNEQLEAAAVEGWHVAIVWDEFYERIDGY
ncbi:PREDICTED: uncharacterized protein At5g06450-like [Tarenaya hassleriana]|uniref:uncharacterized protein At5g06450-like n=1 Tax=Tarenaya hassleriana TaxID=28532 RepID=UPI00053C4E9F|nr:PREDICTED: uncharacterized protein At5g06450-like [Tarenaya hassleriana]